MMLGLPPDTHPRDLVKIGRNILEGSDRAAHRQRRAVQGERRRRQGRRSRRIAGTAVEPARRRPLSRHLCRRGHQGPRHRCDECRDLSRHDGGDKTSIPILMWRAQHIGHHATAWQARGAQGNADRGRDRLGAVARILRGLAGAQGHLRVRRDGRTSAASRSTSSNARPSISTCRLRAEIVIEGYLGLDPESYMMEGPYAEVHRLRRRRRARRSRPSASPHHPSQRSDPARHDRRLHARAAFPRTR